MSSLLRADVVISEGTEAGTRKYEIVVAGEFGEGPPAAEFGIVHLEPGHGVTAVVVNIVDQSHLNGILAWFQDRNIAIESVNPVQPRPTPNHDDAQS
jgi:hypothetical protein